LGVILLEGTYFFGLRQRKIVLVRAREVQRGLMDIIGNLNTEGRKRNSGRLGQGDGKGHKRLRSDRFPGLLRGKNMKDLVEKKEAFRLTTLR